MCKKALDTMATGEGTLSGEESDDELADLSQIFMVPHGGSPQDDGSMQSKGSHQQSLSAILRVLQLKVVGLSREITKTKKRMIKEEQARATFGKTTKHLQLSAPQLEQIEAMVRDGKNEQIVNFEQAMFLVQMMLSLRTDNTKLRLKVREQDIRIKHMETQMPGLAQKADQMSRPENNPEDTTQIRNGVSCEIDDENQSYDSEDDDNVPGLGNSNSMLAQIMAIETADSAKKLGLSMKNQPLKPLVAKKNFRKSIEEKKDEKKRTDLLEIVQEANKDKDKPHEQVVKEVNQRKRQKLENQQLLHLLKESMQKLTVENHVDQEGYLLNAKDRVLRNAETTELAEDFNSEFSQADKLEATFNAVQDKFDILERLDKHGDVNDPTYLRSELQRHSFLLAHEKVGSDRRSQKLKHLYKLNKKSISEVESLNMQVKDLQTKLTQAQSRLYDIASESEPDDYDDDFDQTAATLTETKEPTDMSTKFVEKPQAN